MTRAMKYRKIAQNIVKKLANNLALTMSTGQQPDAYWKPEIAIADALKKVEIETEKRVRAELERIIEEFDRDNGTTSS